MVGGKLLDAEHQTSIVTHIEPDLSHHDFVGSLFCYLVEINLKEVIILTFRHIENNELRNNVVQLCHNKKTSEVHEDIHYFLLLQVGNHDGNANVEVGIGA
jgi:hypothetical protein